jgi:hypothetical protein
MLLLHAYSSEFNNSGHLTMKSKRFAALAEILNKIMQTFILSFFCANFFEFKEIHDQSDQNRKKLA